MDYHQNPDYLDLDDILAQTQHVRCTFLLDIPGLEFLTPSNSDDAKQGRDVLLPYWMAKTLYAQSMIDIKIPDVYRSKFREILTAGAMKVDLHKAGPFYYDFGKLLMELIRENGNNLPEHNLEGQKNRFVRHEGEQLEERKDIAISLIQTFHERRKEIIEFSTNPSADLVGVRDFESRLDNLEKRLFLLGRHHVAERAKWNSRAIELISKTSAAQRISKKRRHHL